MNPTNLKLDIQAFLDGELNSGRKLEVERLLATDPAAAELHARLRSVRDLVRNSEPRPVLNESRDFYWSQIQRRIAQGERESQRRTARR